jgi:hypothetical protein
MGVLSNENFMQQQAYLGSGYASLVRIQNCLLSGVNLIVADTDIDVEVELLSPYNQNYERTSPELTSGLLAGSVNALEQHIQRQTGQEINDYLYVRGLKVCSDFADLSAALGKAIKPINIQT